MYRIWFIVSLLSCMTLVRANAQIFVPVVQVPIVNNNYVPSISPIQQQVQQQQQALQYAPVQIQMPIQQAPQYTPVQVVLQQVPVQAPVEVPVPVVPVPVQSSNFQYNNDNETDSKIFFFTFVTIMALFCCVIFGVIEFLYRKQNRNYATTSSTTSTATTGTNNRTTNEQQRNNTTSNTTTAATTTKATLSLLSEDDFALLPQLKYNHIYKPTDSKQDDDKVDVTKTNTIIVSPIQTYSEMMILSSTRSTSSSVSTLQSQHEQQVSSQYQHQQQCCSICLEDFVQNETIISLPQCNHVFHTHCIKQWLLERKSNSCPFCKCTVVIAKTKKDSITQKRQPTENDDQCDAC